MYEHRYTLVLYTVTRNSVPRGEGGGEGQMHLITENFRIMIDLMGYHLNILPKKWKTLNENKTMKILKHW